jgi:hypothetical protein
LRYNDEDLKSFKELIEEHRYDFARLVYVIWPFGEPGSELEFMKPHDWQMEELVKLSKWMMNPKTRYKIYRLIVSSGNGAAKTALGAMINIMLLYSQRLRGRITANTEPQLRTVVWPEYEKWLRLARFNELFFDSYGTSIQAKNKDLSKAWRLDTVTWSENSPVSISGLHNKGYAVSYTFEEAAGIPANIWTYASGAFTETDTVKIFMAFANSDDPESYFEQCMANSDWNARRIDTRTLDYIDKDLIQQWLKDCGGNEDHDDFRTRVRGLPRKSSKDSIFSLEHIEAAIERAKDFDVASVTSMPVVLGCDPAWTGGDETVLSMRIGNYVKILERYKLNKAKGQDHMYTYQRLCFWEAELGADAVFIDQGEGTAIFTLANQAGKAWELVSFAQTPNDAADFNTSQYVNMRAKMYYEAAEFVQRGGVLDVAKPEWVKDLKAQLTWTKGGRHKINLKKLAEPKTDIKKRVGKSPDIADAVVILFYRQVTEKIFSGDVGSEPFKMPSWSNIYDAEYEVIY